ncbi:hypothetical protein [Sphingobium ummariense]|nr:hypothetical protein [Sphingobium ummariense]
MFAEYVAPSEVSPESIRGFFDKLKAHLVASGNGVKDEPQPANLYKEVSKRVGPLSRKNHESIGSAVMLFCLEGEDLANRIRRYQYIERYRSMVDDETQKEMVQALTEHTYTLRSYEIYTVLERATQTLKFGHEVAKAINLPSVMNDKKYEKQMKKEFEHRLRERHRIVHAHERPSLVSRITALAPEAFKVPEVQNYLIALIKMNSSMLRLLKQKHPEIKMPDASDKGFYRGYLARVDEEAKNMWELFKTYIEECVGMQQT